MDGLLAVKFVVTKEKENHFVAWKEKMDAILPFAKGFKNRFDLQAVQNNNNHYVLLRFDSTENARMWMNSKFRRRMLEELRLNISEIKEEVVHEWESFWFTTLKKANKWKLWFIVFIAVYPLTVLIPEFVNALSGFISMNEFLGGIFRAVLISGFMTLLLIPFMTRLFRKWLHK
jgi:uncharacterized protein